MNKAFTKESEAEVDFEDEIPALPAATKNYITPEGLQRLQDEFAQLQKIERPKAVETVSWAAAMATGRKMATIFTASGVCERSTDECGFSAKEWRSPKPSIPRGKRIASESISARQSFIATRGMKKRLSGS